MISYKFVVPPLRTSITFLGLNSREMKMHNYQREVHSKFTHNGQKLEIHANFTNKRINEVLTRPWTEHNWITGSFTVMPGRDAQQREINAKASATEVREWTSIVPCLRGLTSVCFFCSGLARKKDTGTFLGEGNASYLQSLEGTRP